MLSPEARTVAMELLKPPPGYRLDKAVLTTYALELDVLLALPLAVLAQSEQSVEDLLTDPLLLLEAMREAGERINVFVDAGGISVPGNSRALYGALESSVHPVNAPNGGAFHPKVWVARFVGDDQPPLIRLSVASRNLTFDRSWDMALTSEASPEENPVEPSRPMAEFLQRLPMLSTEALSEVVQRSLADLANEVGQSAFPSPPEFYTQDIQFHVLGLNTPGKLWQPVARARTVLAMSPFVSSGVLQDLGKRASGETVLISRPEELDQLSGDWAVQWNQIKVLQQGAEGEPEDQPQTDYSGLHAKVLISEWYHEATWFIGSANLTSAAFCGHNVEVMASVSGSKGQPGSGKGVGIYPFLEGGFQSLCVDYQPATELDDRGDSQTDRRLLEDSQKAILSAELSLICRPNGKDWQLSLRGEVAGLDERVQIVCWPVSIEAHQATACTEGVAWTLPAARLTAFMAFLVATEGSDETLRFALKLPVTGMPETRLHDVLRTLIDSPERLLQFLRALLGGLEDIRGFIDDEGTSSWRLSANRGLGGEALLEDMLRAVSRDPERLIPIKRLIEDLRTSEEGRGIAPDDLYAVWQVMESVLQERSPPDATT